METESPAVVEALEAASPAKIHIVAWFSAKLKEHKRLRPGHYDTILAFFNNKKLKEEETKETFDKALKEFGF